jgi:predicted transcriptional regulator
MKEGYSVKIRDNMRPMINAFVQSDQTIDDALQLMMTNNVHVLPVFTGKKAVGVLRAIDILDFIGDLLISHTENNN